MKVRELLKMLNGIDPELEVILQKDDEGNGYRKSIGVDDDCYTNNLDDYDIEVVPEEDRDELCSEYELVAEDYKQVVVIY